MRHLRSLPLLAAICLLCAATCTARPLVIGHRGAPSWRLEETLASWEVAASLGADFIEADLCITADNQLVCRHECELSETTDVAERPEFAHLQRARAIHGDGGGWYTEDMTLAEIRTLRAKERLEASVRTHAYDGLYGVSTLAEYLQNAAALQGLQSAAPAVPVREEAPSVGVYIETKSKLYRSDLWHGCHIRVTRWLTWRQTPSYFRGIGQPVEELLLQALADAGLEEPCRRAYEAYHEEDPAAWVRACGVILQSFEDNLATYVHPTHYFYPMVQLMGGPAEVMAGSDITYGELMTADGLSSVAEWAVGIGPNKETLLAYTREGEAEGEEECEGISFSYESTGLLEAAHEANLLVHPWTFRREEAYMQCAFANDADAELAAFFELGVDGVFTDDAQVAVSVRDRMFVQESNAISMLTWVLYGVTLATCAAFLVLMAVATAAYVVGKRNGKASAEPQFKEEVEVH